MRSRQHVHKRRRPAPVLVSDPLKLAILMQSEDSMDETGEGVMVIIRQRHPNAEAEYLLVWDRVKGPMNTPNKKFGFVTGARKIGDVNIETTVLREVREESGIDLTGLPLIKLEEVEVAHDYTQHIFFVDVPEDTEGRPGEDQEVVVWQTAGEIREFFIATELFLSKHTLAFERFVNRTDLNPAA